MKLLIAATLASSLATSAWAAPYLTVSEIDVKDPAAYKEWLPDVQKHIADAGGKYLAGGFEKTTMLIGPPVHNRLVIIQYPDKATWEKWWKETGDADIKKAEGKFATFHIYGVEGIDAPAPQPSK
jgi:uncharacterized protein (DUF1330 family)